MDANEADMRKELQEILVQVESYRRQLDSLSKEVQVADATLEEANATLSALAALKEKADGAEILVTIGSGSFVRATLKDAQKVIMGVGAGLSVEKSVDEAKKILEDRSADLSKVMEKLQGAAAEINSRMNGLDSRYREIMGSMQAEGKQI